jgi:hypothetical protein
VTSRPGMARSAGVLGCASRVALRASPSRSVATCPHRFCRLGAWVVVVGAWVAGMAHAHALPAWRGWPRSCAPARGAAASRARGRVRV